MTKNNNPSKEQVAEYSLRLVIPFSFEHSIQQVTQYFTQMDIERLFVDDAPFCHLIRKPPKIITTSVVKSEWQVYNKAIFTYVDKSCIYSCYPFFPVIIEIDPYIRPIKSSITKKTEDNQKKHKEPSINKLKKQKIWEDNHAYVSEDLYPHIRRIMMAQHPNESVSLQMTQSAWQLLNGGYGNFGLGLALTLSNTAKKRLNTKDIYLPLSICQNDTKPTIHLFAIGLGVLVIEAAVDKKYLKKYGINACKELLHELSRAQTQNNNLTWLVKSQANYQITQLPNKTNFTHLMGLCLGVDLTKDEMVKTPCEQQSNPQMVKNKPVAISINEESRYFSFSAMRIMQAKEEAQIKELSLVQLADSLAQRHTIHYGVTEQQINNNIFMPYNNIVYAMSTEGGSVVIDTTKDDDTLIQHNVSFISDVLKKAYFPMLLLSFIEFRYLIKLTSDVCPEYQIMSADDMTIAELEKQREKILHFRLHFRYSQASQISNHNHFYSKWRDIFGNDKLSDELSDDINQINSFLNYQSDKIAQQVKDKQDRIFTVFGIIATTLLSVLGLFGTNFAIFNQPDMNIFSNVTILTLLIGIAIAGILVCVYLWVLRINKDD